MGYTHYWSHADIEPAVWAGLAQDTRKILGHIHSIVEVVNGDGEAGSEPTVSDAHITFNGTQANDEWHETFSLVPAATEFDFCKTNRKPYDLAVTTVLLRFAVVIPTFYFWSDGAWEEEWEETCGYYCEIFGINPATIMGLRRPPERVR
jgi:hypothetical protein